MADTTRVRILAARAIVSASCLDRLPTRKRLEQLTHQCRFSDIGSKPTNTNYNRLLHIISFLSLQIGGLSSPPLLRRYVRGGDLQNSARVLVKIVTDFLHLATFIFLNTHRKALALALPFDFRRQVTSHVRTAIRRVMLLITLVVAQNVNAIEVRLIQPVRLIRTTLL